MGIDCTKCKNSGCCKLVVEVDKEEYESLDSKVKNEFIKRIDLFLKDNEGYVEKKEVLDKMYYSNYAVMKKSSDGLCTMLDRETLLCTVYENRPNVCKDYTSNRCEKIRML